MYQREDGLALAEVLADVEVDVIGKARERLIAGLLGAVVFLPSGGYIADGPSGCEVCGSYTMLLIGGSVRGEQYGALVAFGAALGTFIAVGAWALRRKSSGAAAIGEGLGRRASPH